MSLRSNNGRFIKKKAADKIAKALASMSEAKKLKIQKTFQKTAKCEIPDENCIVSLKELAKNLKCISCRSLLNMDKLSDFKKVGLYAKFKIKCDTYTKCNIVNTGLMRNEVSDINSSVILGAIHAGVGNTGLNKILACANLPRINDNIYKKYENIIGKAIESEAKESCKRAALKEKELVLKNIKKLCDIL